MSERLGDGRSEHAHKKNVRHMGMLAPKRRTFVIGELPAAPRVAARIRASPQPPSSAALAAMRHRRRCPMPHA
jgi:hypothetical protein